MTFSPPCDDPFQWASVWLAFAMRLRFCWTIWKTCIWRILSLWLFKMEKWSLQLSQLSGTQMVSHGVQTWGTHNENLCPKLEFSRTEVRKFPQLAGFHQWMIAEAEAGHITRQELVSMIPTLLMDVKSHHAVLDMCAAPGKDSKFLLENKLLNFFPYLIKVQKRPKLLKPFTWMLVTAKFQVVSALQMMRITHAATCLFIRRSDSTRPVVWL